MDSVLRETVTALGCLMLVLTWCFSLPLEIPLPIAGCYCPFPTFFMGQLKTSSYGGPSQASVCFLLCADFPLCLGFCSWDAAWEDRDAGEAIEKRDKHHCIFVFFKNSKCLASWSYWGQRLPETRPPLQLSFLAKKLRSEYALRLSPVSSTRITSTGEPYPVHSFLWE